MVRTTNVQPSRFDRAVRPVHRWVWSDQHRCARKLLSFAATEADGGRDLARAAELTPDALLRRLYLRHALDEQGHATLFEARGRAILAGLPARGAPSFEANWFAPGERGLDDLRVDREPDESLLAFLHLSEKAAAGRFAMYRDVLAHDPATRAMFNRILRDEVFHVSYTRRQLARIAPTRDRKRLWRARAGRLWKAYLRVAVAIGAVLGKVMLVVQYFVVLPLFALLAKRAARREARGWIAASSHAGSAMDSARSQY